LSLPFDVIDQTYRSSTLIQVKGIILAGGTGSRLWPLTKTTSKQLLPVYDKPLIYYPLSTLMLAGIREILIITTPQDSESFKSLLEDGSSIGISITYAVQPKPEGLAQAFLIGEDFIGNESVALILGDNIFYGPGLGRKLSDIKNFSGATIFGVKVKDPERYGVVDTLPNGKVISVEEKPSNPKSKIAIPGLYFFDNTVPNRAKGVTKSPRGELEITSVIETYLKDESLQLRELSESTAWMDCGTVDSMNEAANYVRSVEESIGFKIGCIEEIAYRQSWIDRNQLSTLAEALGSNEYAKYLKDILQNENLDLR
jgi:glucose-1-phosphate thymidylyltransferase